MLDERLMQLSLLSESCCTQVDDLLQGCKVHITGPDAVDAVAIEHPGFALWPMADKESQEAAQLETTAAVLIPDDMVPDSESDDDSSA